MGVGTSLLFPVLGHLLADGAGGGPIYETVVEAEPAPGTGLLEPVAVSKVPGAAAQTDRPQQTIGDALVAVPGAWTSNRENHAQDLRISVRGFGDRAAFGVRGIRVFVDGVPYTLPDGQTTLEDIDPGEVAAIQVVRGPTSAFHGNAGGGALLLTSAAPPAGHVRGARVEAGSFSTGLARLYGLGQEAGRGYTVSAHWLGTEGWRERARALKGGGRSRWWLSVGPNAELHGSLGFSLLPLAEDPGGLSASDVRADERQASSTSREYRLSESATLGRGSLSLHYRPARRHALKLVLHGQTRTLDNAIPRRYVFLGRYAGGILGSYQNESPVLGMRGQLVLGLALEAQHDHRRNLMNDEGHPVPPLLLDENEQVSGTAVFGSQVVEPRPWLALRLGGRLDRIGFSVSDFVLEDGNQSGRRAFTLGSAFAGLAVALDSRSALYANFAQSFETPTASELTMRPGGLPGINPDLRPQRATGLELGARTRRGALQATLAGFRIDVRDELVRFEDNAGRAYFRNAGRSHRNGLEAALGWESSALVVRSSYTLLDAVFDVYQVGGQDLSGNHVPGVPRHRLGVDGTLALGPAVAVGWQAAFVHPLWADDANVTRSRAQWMSEARAVYRLRRRAWQVDLFLAARNLAGRHYEDNVRVNAAGARYFEPAPPFSVRAGIALTHHTPAP